MGKTFDAVWSYDSNQVYPFERKSFSIVNSDGSNKEPIECSTCPPTPTYSLAISGDGQLAFIADGQLTIVSQVLSTSKSFPSSQDNYLMWFPDNKNLLISNFRSNFFSILNIDSGEEEPLTLTPPLGSDFHNPCLVSPDGKNIFFTSNYGSIQVPFGKGWARIPKNKFILLKSPGNNDLTRFTSYEAGFESCPVWVSNSE